MPGVGVECKRASRRGESRQGVEPGQDHVSIPYDKYKPVQLVFSPIVANDRPRWFVDGAEGGGVVRGTGQKS